MISCSQTQHYFSFLLDPQSKNLFVFFPLRKSMKFIPIVLFRGTTPTPECLIE